MTKTAYKHKKWQRVNWSIVKQVYILKEEEISFEDLAKEFNINPRHLAKVVSDEGWKAQRKLWQDKILIKTSEKLTNRQAEIRARSIAVAEGALGFLANCIKKQDLRASVSDIDKIIRLIEFLYGNADSRPDYASGIENLIREMGKQRAKEHREIASEDRQITQGGDENEK